MAKHEFIAQGIVYIIRLFAMLALVGGIGLVCGVEWQSITPFERTVLIMGVLALVSIDEARDAIIRKLNQRSA